jgi:hypothetical protein
MPRVIGSEDFTHCTLANGGWITIGVAERMPNARFYRSQRAGIVGQRVRRTLLNGDPAGR